MRIITPKPCFEFVSEDGSVIGTIMLLKGKLSFTGDVEESARIFLDYFTRLTTYTEGEQNED